MTVGPLRFVPVALFSAFLAIGLAGPASAQQPLAAAPAPAVSSGPDFDLVISLASTLGEAHAIRSICNGETDQTWRNYMLGLMEIEAGTPQRRSALSSAFNRGYRTQEKNTDGCSPAMTRIEAEISSRGRALADQIAKSYLD